MSSRHEAAFLSSWRRSIELKGRGEDALEAEQPLGLFEAYLFIMERHRVFLLRSQRPSEAK